MNPYWAMLAGAIATTMVGQALLKAGAGRSDFASQLFDWHTMLGLVLYGGSAMLYIGALRRIPMSVALPCSAVSYGAAAIIGHYGFGEPLGPLHIGAIGVISVGVIMLACA